MNAIIFSKDRAMQLDALLGSMDKFAHRSKPPIAIVNATSDRFRWAYDELYVRGRFTPKGQRPQAGFCYSVEQGNFKAVLTHDVERYGGSGLVLLLCDDALFYRPMPQISIGRGECYSLHLGKNITHCYMLDCPEQDPHGPDFDYPCSVDGYIYHVDDLLPLLKRLEYRNPNELEQAMVDSGFRPKKRWGEHGCLVGIPHNLVGPNKTNRNMGGSAEELNERFLRGERINIDAMDFSDVHGVHQEIPYVFRKEK